METEQVHSQAGAALDRMGGINRIKDVTITSPTGGEKVISREQIIDKAVVRKEEYFDTYQEQLIGKGTDPAEARTITNRMRMEWYSKNNIENTEWSSMLNGMAGQATSDTLLQKGEVSEYLKANAELYRQLRATNRPYLNTLLTNKDSREFFEVYDRNVSLRRMPSDEALLNAANMASRPEHLKAKSILSPQDTERLTRSTLRSLDLDERSYNVEYLTYQIETMSKNGATEQEIKKTIEEDIRTNAVPINGVLVHSSRDLPDDFPELMELEMQKRFEEFGESYGIEDVSDLYIAADDAGDKWYIHSKSKRFPVGTAPITGRTLEAHRETRRAAQEEKVRELARAEEAARPAKVAEFNASGAEQKERIAYWREMASKRGSVRGSVAEKIADQYQRNLDEQLDFTGEIAKQEIKDLEAKIKGAQAKEAAASKERIKYLQNFLKSVLPSIRIGNWTYNQPE